MLLCIGDSTVAILHMDDGKYYIFDSHSRNIEGYPTPNGRAVLLSFNFLKELYNYLRKLAMVLNADKFELTPIQITRCFSHNEIDNYSAYENTTITHLKPGEHSSIEGHDMKTQKTLLLSESKNISKLLVEQNNQKDRRKRKHTIDNTMNQSCKVSEHNIETEEFKTEKRKKYMRESMAKRRQQKRSECNGEPPATKIVMHYKEQDENNTTIQRKLNKKIYIQRRHSNPEYKDLEKEAMKLKCSDPAYKQHELNTKKAKQLDPVYKQHEADAMKAK